MRAGLALILALHGVVGGAFVAGSRGTPSGSDPQEIALPTPERVPGLVVAFSNGKTEDARPSRLAALHVPAGSAPTPFLEPGPFTATFTGYLLLDMRTKAAFTAAGNGSVKVEIRGKVVFEGTSDDLSLIPSRPQRVRKGENPVKITYTSPKTGDATFRLYWQGTRFPREPLAPKLLSSDRRPPDTVRQGRTAFARHRCVACHHSETPLPKGAMPELAMGAPSLEDIGARLQPAWIAQWIVNPRRMRHGATMPALFGHETLEQALEKDTRPFDVTAYLRRLGRDDKPQDVAPSETGGVLFAKLGCISCHTRPDRPAAAAEQDLIPLNRVGTKFFSGALAEFLKNPRAHYPWSRMPDFKLTDEEARALAGWLVGAAKPPASPPIPAGDPERGKELVKTLGCTSCHEGLGHEPAPSGPSLQSIFAADWSADGCVSPGRSGGRAPDLGLDGDTDALRALRSVGDPGALFRHAAVEFAERQIRETRCTACHAYDELPDLWSTRVTETHDLHRDHAPEDGEGKVSQIRPTLTWLGEKLHGRWTAEFISGELPALRPWLDARMPAFPTRGSLMARGISHAHGFPVTEAPPATPDPALVEPGEFLIKKDGFGCTACHGIHDQKPYATFEFAAPNFEHSYKRLRHEYYTRWMWNPTRVEFRYRMPIYANPQDNESLQDEVLEGVADQQFEAMWQYLQTLAN